MPEYVLLSYLPTEEPSREAMAAEYPRWQAFMEDLTNAGVLRGNRGLSPADTATSVRVRGGETQLTDGPFAETKEYLNGYFLIEVDDLDAAIGYAAAMPSSAHGCVEVRPVYG